jgi:two-component system, NarL family, nitrate/nitrite response regulator NarL
MQMTTTRVRVVIADDHPMFRAGIVFTFKNAACFDVVGEAATAEEAIKAAQTLQPDVVLLDINMPGSGLTAAAEITRTCPKVRVVMLTVAETSDTVNTALEAGASGYVLKGATGTELVRVVQSICGGESYVTPALGAKLLAQMRQKAISRKADGISDLTTREEEILAQVALGLTNKEIAKRLKLSEKTVKHYMTNVMQKLQVRNRVEAAMHLQRNNLQ